MKIKLTELRSIIAEEVEKITLEALAPSRPRRGIWHNPGGFDDAGEPCVVVGPGRRANRLTIQLEDGTEKDVHAGEVDIKPNLLRKVDFRRLGIGPQVSDRLKGRY